MVIRNTKWNNDFKIKMKIKILIILFVAKLVRWEMRMIMATSPGNPIQSNPKLDTKIDRRSVHCCTCLRTHTPT